MIGELDAGSFLLGQAFRSMKRVQQHLIQNENKEALDLLNDDIRFLIEEINKHFPTIEACIQAKSKL